VPTPKKKLPFEGHRGMVETRHGMARRRGVRERANGDGAVGGGEEGSLLSPLIWGSVDWALEGPYK
jgi:hypothetical protein